jgi:hypothetical protein
VVIARELARDFPGNRELVRFLETNRGAGGDARTDAGRTPGVRRPD